MRIFAKGSCGSIHKLECFGISVDMNGAVNALQLGAARSTRYIRLCNWLDACDSFYKDRLEPPSWLSFLYINIINIIGPSLGLPEDE